MINVGLNQASAAFGMTYGGLAQEGPERSKMLEAMQEVIRLANAEGVPLPPDDDVRWLAAAIPTFKPDNKPSMGQDVDAHRLTEVEEFAGTRPAAVGQTRPAHPRQRLFLSEDPGHRGRLV